MGFSRYTTKSAAEVLADLKTSESGLSPREAGERLKIYGLNEVKAKEAGLSDILWRQFRSPFFYLLLVAAVIAFLVGERLNSLVILVFILINVTLGFFQEAKAERAQALLKKYLPEKVRILRNGTEAEIYKNLLVPGDLVLLEAGNIIPADLRLIKLKNFLVDESVLTGESVPVPKVSQSLFEETEEIFEAENVAFSGTAVVSGEAVGVVISIGKKTAFGEIAKLVSKIKRESAYEKDLLNFCQIILRTVVVTIALIFLANFFVKGLSNFSDFLIFSVALIVSVVPEALPVVVTFALSEGALRLAKEKVVVKRLTAVEDLGNVEILCVDKTGTLTENKLELKNILAKDKEKCLLYGLLASACVKEEIESSQNPFDTALFAKASPEIRKALSEFKVLSEMPFDPFRLRNSVLVEDKEGRKTLIVRGAPEKILKLSSKLDSLKKDEVNKKIEKEGREGKRVLATAFREFLGGDFSEKDEEGATFLGLFSFKDPLKKTAKEAINLSQKLGLKIKIVTGDSKEVAGAIAKEVGLIKDQKKVVLGETLESLSERDFEKVVAESLVFARVSPSTKYRIVKTLSQKYEVGFLGEGINDAPALKAAHLAIAVESAADVSRDVSDIVLLKKDLKVIVAGIWLGRNIFSNINKYIKTTLASNFGNFYSIALISLFIPFLPMLPAQILLVNLLSDFPLITVAADSVDVEELKKPKSYRLGNFIWLIILLALISSTFDFIFFGIFHKSPPSLLQTLWFIESILTEIFLIFSVRSSHFFAKAKTPSLPLALISFLTILTTILLPFTRFGQETFHFVSPPPFPLFLVLLLVMSYFLVSELAKLLYFRFRHQPT